SASSYQLRTGVLNDSGTPVYGSYTDISDAAHMVELDWRAASAAGANNGSVTLWIDEVQKGTMSGIDNDQQRIDRVRLGAVSGLTAGTSGTFYLDAFISRRISYIGDDLGGLAFIVEPSETPTLEPTAEVTVEAITEPTDELTPEATLELTPERTIEPTDELTP